jgi:hypothetical protein
MTVMAIMQPTYLPWAGYFNLINSVDIFVFLDDVRLAPRSWQQRNRILFNGEARWLTVPIEGGRNQRLCDVVVDDAQPWRRKHERTIQHAYSHHPFFSEVIQPVTSVIGKQQRHLVTINIDLIESFMRLLNIFVPTHRSSGIPSSGEKSERLLSICRALGATEFLSARGSQEYLEAEGAFRSAAAPIRYHDYEPRIYEQFGHAGEHVSHLSIIDVVANVGVAGAAQHIRSSTA